MSSLSSPIIQYLKSSCYNLPPQNFFYSLSFSQFINQFVQRSDFLHQRIFNLLHTATTNHSLDKPAVWIHLRCFIKKGSKLLYPAVPVILSCNPFLSYPISQQIISSSPCFVRFFFSTFADNNGLNHGDFHFKYLILLLSVSLWKNKKS